MCVFAKVTVWALLTLVHGAARTIARQMCECRLFTIQTNDRATVAKVRFPPFEDRSSCSAGRERGLRPLEANHSLPRAMTLRVFVSGVETISPESHRDASLRSDLALVAGEKGDQSSAGNHLLALEVDEARSTGSTSPPQTRARVSA